MLNDEEEQRPQKRLTNPKLDALGVAELEAYIAELRAEITRAEGEIARKRDHRSEADRFFRRP